MKKLTSRCAGPGCEWLIEMPLATVPRSRFLKQAGWVHRGTVRGQVHFCPDCIPSEDIEPRRETQT